jgi:CheY-like chemotaxis protein
MQATVGTALATAGGARQNAGFFVFNWDSRHQEVFRRETGAMFVQDATAELWADETVRCVLVPHATDVEVELRNADGSPFLRKTASSRQAALNQGEYLRLLLRASGRPAVSGALKPFALVIEDDARSREVLGAALRICGMRALSCGTGLEGVALAHELTPDLVLVTDRLSDVSGVEVCRRLRADPITAAIPIMAVTPWPQITRAEGCQADAVLSKPCDLETLVASARLLVRHLTSAADGGA